MSGPKSSAYRLNAAQRRALQQEAERKRQAQLRQARILTARERLSAHRQQLSKLVSLAQSILDEAFIPQHLKEQADDLLTACRQADGRCATALESNDPSVLEQACASFSGMVQALMTELDTLSTLLPDAVANERISIEDAIADGFRLALPDAVQQAVDQDAEIRREINRRVEALRTLALPKAASEELDRLLKKAGTITQADFLENYLALDIDPFIQKCQCCAAMDYAGIRARYELLASEYHVAPQDFEYSVQGIQDMKAASDALEAAILEDRERAYIHEVLEAAIREMGYRLIGDRVVVRTNTGKRIHHRLYSLHAGTAVNVTFADNGQIVMELGGITHSDRMPTAEESASLAEDMRSFCQDYAQLERKLAEHGIQANRISTLPPDAQYARVFNAEHYSLTEAVTDYAPGSMRKHTDQSMHRGE